MAITQTVDIPADRRLTIEVPREVPSGRTILTYTPVTKTQEPGYVSECPECAKHRDPKTGELRFNAVTLAAFQETSDIMSGKKKVKWERFQPGITKAEAKEKLKKTLGSK